jgi:hypothetical protein
MVKNIPTVERSTKIRFGKNSTDDQGENTIVFNASNVEIDTTQPGSVYMTPLRLRADLTDRNITVLAYNTITKEVMDSGAIAEDILRFSLEAAVINGNVTANTVSFNNAITSVTTLSNVGVANGSPIHTLDVGSNLYVDDTGSNVLSVSGNVAIQGDLNVTGSVTTIDTTNLTIKDAIIELGKGNLDSDMGIIMDRTGTNVTMGFLEDERKFVIAYTESDANESNIVPSSTPIDTHIYGNLEIDSNLVVHGNTFRVDSTTGSVNVSNEFIVSNTFRVDTANASVAINTIAYRGGSLEVNGDSYFDGNITANGGVFHVNQTDSHVGVNTNTPSVELDVIGRINATGSIDTDTDLNVAGEAYISSNLNAQSHLNVTGSANISSNLNAQSELNVIGNAFVSSNAIVSGNVDVQSELNVTGNAFISSNLNAQSELNVTGNAFVFSNLNAQSELNVTGNAFVFSNLNAQSELNVTGNAFVFSNLNAQSELNVTGNAFVSSNLNAQSELNVTGNAFISSNVIVTGNTDVQSELNVTGNAFISSNLNAQSELNVTGNAFVSSNLNAQSELNVTGNAFVFSNLNAQSELNVTGNVFVDSNIIVTNNVNAATYYGDGGLLSNVNLQVVSDHGNATSNTIRFTNPTTALTTDLTSNVEVKLDQLNSVSINGPLADHLLVYDGSNWVNEYPMHTYIQIRNDAGQVINAGDAVYVKGTHNANILNVGLAKSDSPGTMPCIGLSNQILEAGEVGTAVAYGKALSVVTEDFIAGETVYVSNTVLGGLSNVKPYNNDLIQNVGVVTKVHESNGGVFVTGIGRSNDIPNAPIVLDETDINYVYVNNQNNDLKKIEPSNLLTQLQTLQQVTDTGNATSNTIRFTNVTTGLVTTGNVEIGSNISVTGLADPINKHLPMVGTDGFLEKSPIYFTSGGTYVVSAAEAEFLGNLTLSGNTTILNSETVTISDRIFGIGANNAVHTFDTGVMMEHKDDGEYANVALIYHAVGHRFAISYTQNTFTDEQILDYEDADHVMQIDLVGNVEVQHNLVVNENVDVTGTTSLANDLTVGAASNLFVDVSTSRVGINEATPSASLDVGGDARIQDTTDSSSVTTGALVVSGGLGVASNIHSTNVYAGSHIGVGTDAAIVPVHVIGTDAGGIFVKSTDQDNARVALEVSGISGGDPIVSWNVPDGEVFSMGIDNSQSDTFNISNHATDVGTNARLTITPSGTMTLTNTATSLITAGSVGIANTSPIHDLDVGSNLYVEDTGSNVVHVTGNIYATTYYGDGGLLSNIDLQVVTDYSNATSNTIRFTNVTTSLVTTGSVGIANTSPTHDLDVGSNLYVEDTDSNVLTVNGGILANTLTIGTVTVAPGYSFNLENITSVGATTSNTVHFQNNDTSLITNSNVGIGTTSPETLLHVNGGVITNSDAFTRKLYSYSDPTVDYGFSNVALTFASNVFSAKITAQLVHENEEVSTMIFNVQGGTRDGTTSSLNIASSAVSLFGNTNIRPWNPDVTFTPTKVILEPLFDGDADYSVDIFVEYLSSAATGKLETISVDDTVVKAFSY